MTDPPSDGEALFEEAYDELRRLAGGALHRLSPGATLQPTALVHEAWLKLGGRPEAATRGKEHFLALAALAMRQILVDAARKRTAARRGGGAQRLTLVDRLVEGNGEGGGHPAEVDLLDLHASLEVLATVAPRPARLVELRFFGGLDMNESAAVLGIGRSAAFTDWRFAKAWLTDRLNGPLDEGDPHD